MNCKRACGTPECEMWGCQANAVLPEPDVAYLYKEGETVRHPYSGEIIGIVICRIDRDYTDDKGRVHPHLYQGRSNGKVVGLGKYPSYLLRGTVTGREFEWTQRDERLFAKYHADIKKKHAEWKKTHETKEIPI